MIRPTATLMRHQEEGIEFLLGRGSGLVAFEQGLGKTLVAIEAFRRLFEAGGADLMLVLCPNSLKRNWEAEVMRFAPELTTHIISGGARERRRQLGSTEANVVLINYESARAEITGLRALLTKRVGVLVLDESHMAKNRRSLTTIASRHFARLASYRWLLTGTPVTNSPDDIHTQIELVADGAPLGSAAAFQVRYDGTQHDPAKQRALAEEVAPYVLRRRKEECLDLPSKTFVDLYVPLPPWQRRLYDQLRDGLVAEVEGMSGESYRAFAGTALTRLLRLSQVASNPGLVVEVDQRTPAKQKELDAVLEELVEENGRKVIIWSYYVKTIRQLVERYREYGAVALFGDVATDERQTIADRFQQEPAVQVLIANPAAAATGFTLTAATYTIYETLNWRYDLYAQSQDRNHRIGQEQPVTYIRMLAEDTIDEIIVQALERKTAMAGAILGDPAAALDLAGMTPQAFCEMIQSNRIPTG